MIIRSLLAGFSLSGRNVRTLASSCDTPVPPEISSLDAFRSQLLKSPSVLKLIMQEEPMIMGEFYEDMFDSPVKGLKCDVNLRNLSTDMFPQSRFLPLALGVDDAGCHYILQLQQGVVSLAEQFESMYKTFANMKPRILPSSAAGTSYELQCKLLRLIHDEDPQWPSPMAGRLFPRRNANEVWKKMAKNCRKVEFVVVNLADKDSTKGWNPNIEANDWSYLRNLPYKH